MIIGDGMGDGVIVKVLSDDTPAVHTQVHIPGPIRIKAEMIRVFLNPKFIK